MGRGEVEGFGSKGNMSESDNRRVECGAELVRSKPEV
jgi:hypothetical protein